MQRFTTSILLGGLLIMTALGAPRPARALTTPALLDTLQHTGFNYFWNEANASNGLIKDRSTSTSPCSIASVGFGLSAICIASDHGWITRTQARSRVLTTLQTFWNGPQGPAISGTIGYRGLYYHWLDMSTATRTWDSELSTIDTALLFAGIIDARQYFDQNNGTENQIRALADSITWRADWEFMRNLNAGILMGWKPDTGFTGYGQWIGYNEAMIMYLLALGSPTHPVPVSCWDTWTSGYNWSTQYGYTFVIFPPLFGHQYSHCWIDFRNRWDAYMRKPEHRITYFENSQRATLAQRAYCIANPLHRTGYSATLWGLTASDDPFGYSAHGAPPAQNDNGTITPTAAASSIAFQPNEVIPTLHNFYNTYPALFGTYGFKDAFNLDRNPDWYDTDFLGIDQGPIVIMIENYRTEKVWNRFMQNPDIKRGLQQAGFTEVVGIGEEHGTRPPFTLLQNAPNPFRGSSTIGYRLESTMAVKLRLLDIAGREVLVLVDAIQGPGTFQAQIPGESLPNGVYIYELQAGGKSVSRRATLIR